MRRLLALVLLLAACSGNTAISTEGYDQSCDEPNDCVAVFVGDVCGCSCDLGAINASESSLYAQERSRLQDRCETLADCAACPPITVDCVSNVCVAATVEDGGDTDDGGSDTDT